MLRRILKRIMKSAPLLFLCMVLFVEGVLHVYDRYYSGNMHDFIWQWHDDPYYERIDEAPFLVLSPNEEYEVNDDGYRGKKIAIEKPSNTYRIMLLGDSTAFAAGVSVRESFCKKFADLLQKDTEKKVEYINAGVPGYTSLQGKELFKKRFMQYRPDLILTHFGVNDAEVLLPVSDKDLKVLSRAQLLFYRVLLRSKIVYYTQQVVLRYIVPLCAERKRRVSEEDFIDNLLEIQTYAQQWGGKTFFVQPVLLSAHPQGTKEDAAISIGEPVTIPFENTIVIKDKLLETEYHLSQLFLDSCHPSALGHEVYAHIMYEEVKQKSNF